MGAYNPNTGGGAAFNGLVNQIAFGASVSGDVTGMPGFTRTISGGAGGAFNLIMNGSQMSPTKTPIIRMTNATNTRTSNLGVDLLLSNNTTGETGRLSPDLVSLVDGSNNSNLTSDGLTVTSAAANNVISANQSVVTQGLSSTYMLTNSFTALDLTPGADKASELMAGELNIESPSNALLANLFVDPNTGEVGLILDDGGGGAVQLTASTGTGTATATLTATNKPGPTNVTTPAIWLTINVGATSYVVPMFDL